MRKREKNEKDKEPGKERVIMGEIKKDKKEIKTETNKKELGDEKEREKKKY